MEPKNQRWFIGDVAQLGERIHGMDEVRGSIPLVSTQMRNTSLKGHIAETHVLTELVKRGFKVSIPFGDYRYDMVAEKNGRFHRIQVKYLSCKTRHKTLQINFHSVTRTGRRKYGVAEVDHLIAYYEPTKRFFVIPLKDSNNKFTLQLRLTKPVNNQRSKVTFAERYENRWDLLAQ